MSDQARERAAELAEALVEQTGFPYGYRAQWVEKIIPVLAVALHSIQSSTAQACRIMECGHAACNQQTDYTATGDISYCRICEERSQIAQACYGKAAQLARDEYKKWRDSELPDTADINNGGMAASANIASALAALAGSPAPAMERHDAEIRAKIEKEKWEPRCGEDGKPLVCTICNGEIPHADMGWHTNADGVQHENCSYQQQIKELKAAVERREVEIRLTIETALDMAARYFPLTYKKGAPTVESVLEEVSKRAELSKEAGRT